jgi:protein-disulfide isomerase
MASRAEQKQQARAARLAHEAEAAKAARRRRNLMQLGIVVIAAAVLIGVIVVSHGKSSSSGAGKLGPQSAQVAAMFRGIPQHGTQLGNPNAPFTLVEFADLQCPVCREYTLDVQPSVIRDYVRTGKIKVDLKLRTFIGPDSVTAAKLAAATAQQSRIWPFADMWYHQQGEENSGYVTPEFLKKIANATPGLNASKALAASDSAAAAQLINSDEQLANTLQSNGTPDFFIRRGGGPYEPVNPSGLTPQAMAKALNAAIGS